MKLNKDEKFSYEAYHYHGNKVVYKLAYLVHSVFEEKIYTICDNSLYVLYIQFLNMCAYRSYQKNINRCFMQLDDLVTAYRFKFSIDTFIVLLEVYGFMVEKHKLKGYLTNARIKPEFTHDMFIASFTKDFEYNHLYEKLKDKPIAEWAAKLGVPRKGESEFDKLITKY
ncbi:MAG: hypothetical protein P4L50_10220 [Anaerolineaceae bacterium]|nr:hypothetical protein [Anaerolineaceae bacterium]